MSRIFRESKISFYCIIALSVLLSIVVWIRDSSLAYPLYIPLLATVFILGLGFLSAIIFSSILDDHIHTRLLAILHMDLEPESFIKKYEGILHRFPDGSAKGYAAISYLADGYAASGNFKKAISLLSNNIPDTPLSIRGIYFGNLAFYFLASEELANGRQYMEGLKNIAESCRLNQPTLYNNLMETYRLIQNRYHALSHKVVEIDWLEEQMKKASYKLRRLDAAHILYLNALYQEEHTAAKRYLSYLNENGGSTWYANVR